MTPLRLLVRSCGYTALALLASCATAGDKLTFDDVGRPIAAEEASVLGAGGAALHEAIAARSKLVRSDVAGFPTTPPPGEVLGLGRDGRSVPVGVTLGCVHAATARGTGMRSYSATVRVEVATGDASALAQVFTKTATALQVDAERGCRAAALRAMQQLAPGVTEAIDAQLAAPPP